MVFVPVVFEVKRSREFLWVIVMSFRTLNISTASVAEMVEVIGMFLSSLRSSWCAQPYRFASTAVTYARREMPSADVASMM